MWPRTGAHSAAAPHGDIIPMGEIARTPGIASRRWMFLRGLGRHSLHWGSFPAQFQQAFPAAEIELLDLAGNGTEAARGSYLKIGAYAQDLRQRSRFVTEGKIPFSILAISMGAMVASAWAEQHPGEIARMVLINTSSRAGFAVLPKAALARTTCAFCEWRCRKTVYWSGSAPSWK